MNKKRKILQDPSLIIILAIIFIFFALFIIYPFISLILKTDSNTWSNILTDGYIFKILFNTILSSLLSTFCAVILGMTFAYSIHYAKVPCKKLFQIIALIPNMAPSIVTGLAFIILFGRRGIITYKLLGLHLNPYGLTGLVIVQTIAFFPLAYMTISGVLKSISPNLELSAQNLGANGGKLFNSITLPLATPGVINAFLLVFINALADFGNPNLIGGNFKTLATESYAVITGEFNLSKGAAISILLIVPSLIVFIIQKYFLGRRSYVTVTGKPSSGLNRNFNSLFTKIVLTTITAFTCIIIVIIFGTVILVAFTKSFGADNSFTLKHIYDGAIVSQHLKNSWIFSIIAAFFVTIIGLILAFVQSRKKFIGRGILDFLAMLPVSLPGTFIGLSLIISFNNYPLKITGTAIIVIIAMIIRQIPVGYRNSMAGFKQIDKSIEDASTNLGADSQKVFTTVVLPMLKNQVSITLIYSFMKSMNTLSTVIFLIVPTTSLASVNILALADQGFYGPASATAVGMVALILITFGIFKLILRDKIKIFDL